MQLKRKFCIGHFYSGKMSLLKDILHNYIHYKCNRDQIIAMRTIANNDDIEKSISSKETRSQRSAFSRHELPTIAMDKSQTEVSAMSSSSDVRPLTIKKAQSEMKKFQRDQLKKAIGV